MTFLFCCLSALFGTTETRGLERLEVHPPELVLFGPGDARRVLVSGFTAAGERVDLTRDTTFGIPGESACVRLGEDGYFEPLADGEATVTVEAAGLSVELLGRRRTLL